MKKAFFSLAAALLLLFSLFGFSTLAAGTDDLSSTVAPGGSICFSNTSSNNEFIHTGPADGRSDCIIDYAIYNSDGSVKASGTGSRGIQNVPAGGRAIITNAGSSTIEVYGKKTAFSASVSSYPALAKLQLAPSASVKFTNISSAGAPVSTGPAAYAAYNSDYTLSDFGTGSASIHTVPVGGYLICTNSTSSTITVYGAYEAFTVESTKKAALNRLTLAVNETAVYTNNSSSDAYINTDKADYAIYYGSGAIMTYGTGVAGNKSVPSGGSIVITNSGNTPIDIYGAAEIFSSSKGGQPALLRKTVEGGASILLINVTSESSSVYTGRADYASYASNGNLTGFASNSSGTRAVEAYGSIVITNNLTASVTVYAPFEVFKAEPSSAPALLNTTLSKGKTVRFENKGTLAANVYLSRGDYAVYNSEGSFVACAENCSGMIEVPSRGEIVITNNNSSDLRAYAPEAVFTRVYSDSNKPALLKTTLPGGSTIVYFNYSSDIAPVTTGKVDYVSAQASGYISAFGSGGSGTFQVSAEGTLKLTNAGSYPVSIYGPFRNFMAWSETVPALYLNEIAPGKNITYYNTTSSRQSLIVGKCKFFVYKHNGVLASSRNNFEGGSVDIPANGRIEIYNIGTSFITVYGPSSCFADKNNYMSIYDVEDPGRELVLPTGLLKSVINSSTALNAIDSALYSFDEEQYKSVAAAEKLALFAENAASRTASQTIKDSQLSLDAEKLKTPASAVTTALTAIKERIGKSEVSLLRELRTIVRFASGSDSLSISITADIKDAEADLIIIDTPSYRLYINPADIAEDAEITASYEDGKLSLETSIVLGLGLSPISAKNLDFQTFKTADETIIAARYNPVSGLIEGNIGNSGVYTVSENKKEFTDIGDYAKEVQDAITFLAAKGIINGKSNTSYAPSATITRAETAALLVRVLGAVYKGEEGSFTDVSKANWFYESAILSQKLGLIGGYTDGSFKGNNVITKNELLTVAARLLSSRMGWGEGNSSDLDKYKDAVPDWARASAALCLKAELYPERVDGSFSGAEGLTRADAAVILYRLYMLMN